MNWEYSQHDISSDRSILFLFYNYFNKNPHNRLLFYNHVLRHNVYTLYKNRELNLDAYDSL